MRSCFDYMTIGIDFAYYFFAIRVLVGQIKATPQGNLFFIRTRNADSLVEKFNYEIILKMK
jgi:hypothetical protein